jgi:hypothetical protein
MAWDVEFTDEFGEWWDTLDAEEQDTIAVAVGRLEETGPQFPYPYSSKITTSRHGQMRELRAPHRGAPYRVLCAFDPRRVALLLIGGSKEGDDRWYERFVPIADALYDAHLAEIREEG